MSKAPFTEAEVECLTAWQECDWVHPLTCPHRGEGHRETRDLGVLEVRATGLHCPDCDYHQVWVPDVCTLPIPQQRWGLS